MAYTCHLFNRRGGCAYQMCIRDRVERLPLGAVVHQEVYTDYTPTSIDALYHDKEELEVNKQFVRENDKETLAQVFTDVRYTKANNEYFSGVLLKVLNDQGFMK